jgi:hypothetical protein
LSTFALTKPQENMFFMNILNIERLDCVMRINIFSSQLKAQDQGEHWPVYASHTCVAFIGQLGNCQIYLQDYWIQT